MINYRVGDLDALLEALGKEGVEIDSQARGLRPGVFSGSWTREGNQFQLWEPPKEK